MIKLEAEDVFRAVKNAGDAGLLELLPEPGADQGPGQRFFESLQRDLLDYVDLEKLDKTLFFLAPTIQFLGEQRHWEPADFTSSDMFLAVKHLQEMGVFEILKIRMKIPGHGDRFFEHYQDILVKRFGVEAMDRALYVLGQCICFLATEEAMENVREESD